MDDGGWKSRKFLMSMLGISLSSAMLWFDKIDPATWQWSLIACIGLYVGGNAAAKFAHRA